jgi:hypothetical protein
LDYENDRLFFSKEFVQLVDRNVVNKPLLDVLFKISVSDGLEQAKFKMLDYLKMARNPEKDNISNDSELKDRSMPSTK